MPLQGDQKHLPCFLIGALSGLPACKNTHKLFAVYFKGSFEIVLESTRPDSPRCYSEKNFWIFEINP